MGDDIDSHGRSMTPDGLYARLRRGDALTILDVRDRDEFEAWHISGAAVTATQVPLTKFVQAEVTGGVADLADGLTEPVVAVCGHGEASAHVADLLVEADVDAVNLEGGMEEWARVYVREELTADGDANARVFQYRRPSSGCLAYLVVSGGEAAVVDPLRVFADRYVADADALGVDLTYAVDTHVHADHVSGVRAVAGVTGAEVVLPEGATDRGLDFDATLAAGGDAFPLGDTSFVAVHLPGHTSEMTGFRVGDVLCAGDSLFLESVARPDLESGDEGAPAAARRLHWTLEERFSTFPDDLVVAPAHYSDAAAPASDGTYTATLGDLRDRLPALSMTEPQFVEYVLGDLPPRPANFETVVAVNLGERDATDDEAFELELGPNNCAATALAD